MYHKTREKIKAILWIALVLTGYKIIGDLFLHIHFRTDVISGISAHLFSIGRKAMQFIYLVFITYQCRWMRDLKFDKKRFMQGIKMVYPLCICYGILLCVGVFRSAGLFSATGIGQTITVGSLLNKFVYYFAGVAITEEILFRVILLRKLSFLNELGQKPKWNWAVIVQALIFGAMHGCRFLQTGQYVNAFVSMAWAAVGGLIYGVVYVKSRSIWAAVFLHGFYDFAVSLAYL